MRKATLALEDDALVIDDLRVSLNTIPQALYELAHPDPRKWYNFERVGDLLIVHIEIRERPEAMEAINGNYVTERSPSLSSQGSETQNPLDEHRPDGQQWLHRLARASGQGGEPADRWPAQQQAIPHE